MPKQQLTWALVIATYQRQHILLRCLRLAARQTRPPKEIIVVDASPNWDQSCDLVQKEFSASFPTIQLTYQQAIKPSSTVQRNQGIKLSTSDILFLIDDDSLMYLDCAEEVMKIYEADTQQNVKGISTISVSKPPDSEELAAQKLEQKGTVAEPPKQTWIRRMVKSLLQTKETYFLPYDESYPHHPIPQEIQGLNYGVIQVMSGHRMTFRRNILQQESFNEILTRYAAGEDQDLSYRVSRHGLLLNAINAKLCHLEISGGRLSQYTVTALAALNPAVLQQFYSTNLRQSHQRWTKIIQRRLLIYFLKDFFEKKWTFPRTRGIVYAVSKLEEIYTKSPQELQDFYPQLQETLIANNEK